MKVFNFLTTLLFWVLQNKIPARFGSRQILSSLQFLYPWIKIFWKLVKVELFFFGSIFSSVWYAPQGSQISSKMCLFKASQCFLLSLDSFLGCGFSLIPSSRILIQLCYIVMNFCLGSAPCFSCHICSHQCCVKAYWIICKICFSGLLNEIFWPRNANDGLGRQVWV